MTTLRPGPWRQRAVLLFAALALVATATWSSPALAQAPRCEFAVSLSGGGARGAAHLGVLEVLEENGIRPDCIVGTSMGAIIGAMYAAGHTTDQIAVVLRSISLRNLYTEPFRRATQPLLHRLEQRRTAVRFGIDIDGVHLPRSILSDALVNRLFVENLAPAGFVAGRQFDQLAIPFRTVATNLNTGQRVPLVEGDLARAVRASMSVPLAYAPIVWGDTLLADGGLVDNNPVSLARELGATYVVAVDASTPVEAEFYPDLVGVTSRIIDLLYDTKNRQHAVEPELWIRPNLEGHSFADYAGIDTVIRLGREATEALLEQIPERFHGRPINRSPAPGPEVFDGLPIHDVRVFGNTGLAASFIIAETHLRVGDTFDFARALDAVDHLYATGLMSGVWVDVEPDRDGVRVSLSVVEQTRQTLDIGLAYQSDDQAQAFLRLETRDLFGNGERAQFSAVASTRERRFNLRLHGARLFDAHIGYQLDLTLDKEKPKVYRDAMFVTRAKFVRRSAQLGVNLPFAVDALAQVGVRFGRAEIESQLGLEEQIEASRKHGVLYARLIWDDLTSLTHPIGGKRLSVLVERDDRALGADAGYLRIQVDGRGALPLTRTLVLDTRFVFGASSGDLPIYEQFRIGGPTLVPGLARDELWGNQATAGSIAIAYDFGSVFRAYGRGGAGMVMERLEDIDFGELVYGFGVGLTVATPIGPLQFDYGWSEDQRNRLYVALGWQ